MAPNLTYYSQVHGGQNGAPNGVNSGATRIYPIPTELDYLLAEIRSPKASTTPQKVLSYIAYYYPKLKNPANVQLLTETFFECPLFFNDHGLVDLREGWRIVDCFRYVVDKKYQVSEPSLPFYSFYRAMFTGINAAFSRHNGFWKVPPVVTGCLLTVDSRAEYDPYPEYYESIKAVDARLLDLFETCLVETSSDPSLSTDVRYLECLYMAALQDVISDSTFRSVIAHQPSLPVVIADLVFNSPYGLDCASVYTKKQLEIGDHPAIQQINRLSRLYARLVGFCSKGDHYIDLSLNNIQNYSRQLFATVYGLPNITTDNWQLLKRNLFSVVVIFEGVSKRVYMQGGATLSRKILDTLYSLSFIIDEVGTGGFQTYNFVYYVAADCLNLQDPGTSGLLIQSWLADLKVLDDTSKLAQSKLIFCLNFIDHSLGVLDQEMRIDTIMPMVNALLNQASTQPSLEAAHSVMLKYFTTLEALHKDSDAVLPVYRKRVEGMLLEYLSLTLSQFPARLSLHQLTLIIDTLARVTFPDSLIYSWNPQVCSQLRESLYQACVQAAPMDISETSPDAPVKEGKPALSSTLIRITPLFPLEDYIPWLDKIKSTLIDSSDEAPYLLDRTWDSILTANKFYPQKGSQGFRWWYTKGDPAPKL